MLKQFIQPINASIFAGYSLNGKFNFKLLLLCCMLTVSTHAQTAVNDDPAPTLNIGDAAPPIRVRQWLKGTPVKKFKKGKFYVVELWATWCGPCKAAMPHLSDLARQYKNKVSFVSIDVMEQYMPIHKIKHFVDSMGQKMDYNVAAEDSNFVVNDWLKATGDQGIPHVYVVNAEGNIAWIGHPNDLAGVLAKIAANNWDTKKALTDRNEERRLSNMDSELSYDLLKYIKSPNWANSRDMPDSLLLTIDQIVSKEPKLKYAPNIIAYSFAALLKTDMRKAYEYGKEAVQTKTIFGYEPAFFIMGNIDTFADSLQLSPEIFRLGIEACQAEIAQTIYPEISNDYIIYNRMASWYWRINEHTKAILAQQKAIASLKATKYCSDKKLAPLELQLKKYKDEDFGGVKAFEGLKQ